MKIVNRKTIFLFLYLVIFEASALYSIKKYIICKKNSGVKGFEPLNVGSKFRCLTTWLHPMHVTHNMQKHLLKLRLLSLLITKTKNKISPHPLWYLNALPPESVVNLALGQPG